MVTRKNIWRIAILGLLAALLFPGSGVAASRDYKRTGITITGSPNWKPYSFFDAKGNPDGFFVEFWEKWSEKTGVPVEFRLVSWSDSIKLVRTGECDMQSGLYFTEERNKVFGYTSPFFHSEAVSFVGNGVSCDDTLALLRWGGVADTEEKASIYRMFPDAKVVSFESSLKMFEAMSKGEIQAAVDDWSTVMLTGREMGMDGYLQICETVYRRDLHAIVLKDQVELLALVNEGLAQISEEERRYLVNRWFIRQDEGSFLDDPVTPVAIIVLLSFFVWFWSVYRSG